MMEYMYQINPVLQKGKPVIIYGIGESEKNIFLAMLQQNVYVTAFCLKEEQRTSLKKIYNKKIISLAELKEKYADAYVIVAGQTVVVDGEVLQKAGITNLVVENISITKNGILISGE